jgi:hypothetical protein
MPTTSPFAPFLKGHWPVSLQLRTLKNKHSCLLGFTSHDLACGQRLPQVDISLSEVLKISGMWNELSATSPAPTSPNPLLQVGFPDCFLLPDSSRNIDLRGCQFRVISAAVFSRIGTRISWLTRREPSVRSRHQGEIAGRRIQTLQPNTDALSSKIDRLPCLGGFLGRYQFRGAGKVARTWKRCFRNRIVMRLFFAASRNQFHDVCAFCDAFKRPVSFDHSVYRNGRTF